MLTTLKSPHAVGGTLVTRAQTRALATLVPGLATASASGCASALPCPRSLGRLIEMLSLVLLTTTAPHASRPAASPRRKRRFSTACSAVSLSGRVKRTFWRFPLSRTRASPHRLSRAGLRRHRRGACQRLARRGGGANTLRDTPLSNACPTPPLQQDMPDASGAAGPTTDSDTATGGGACASARDCFPSCFVAYPSTGVRKRKAPKVAGSKKPKKAAKGTRRRHHCFTALDSLLISISPPTCHSGHLLKPGVHQKSSAHRRLQGGVRGKRREVETPRPDDDGEMSLWLSSHRRGGGACVRRSMPGGRHQGCERALGIALSSTSLSLPLLTPAKFPAQGTGETQAHRRVYAPRKSGVEGVASKEDAKGAW